MTFVITYAGICRCVTGIVGFFVFAFGLRATADKDVPWILALFILLMGLGFIACSIVA